MYMGQRMWDHDSSRTPGGPEQPNGLIGGATIEGPTTDGLRHRRAPRIRSDAAGPSSVGGALVAAQRLSDLNTRCQFGRTTAAVP